MSLRPRAICRPRGSLCGDRVQLLDVHKEGIIHLIVPPVDFELLSGREDLATYEFNTKVAKHYFCRACGIHPFYIPRSDPDKVDVNVRCLDEVDPEALQVSKFDGKNWERAGDGKGLGIE